MAGQQAQEEDISMVSLLTLEIITGFTRPVFQLSEDATCLVDSGADTPVWTQGAERLIDTFGEDRIQEVDGKKFLLSGFGKGYEVVNVYIIKNLELKDMKDGGTDRVVFKNLTIACTSRPTMVADLILPSTAFSHMNYKICNIGVEYPVIEIEHEKEEYYVNPIYRLDDDSFVERVYSFSNE